MQIWVPFALNIGPDEFACSDNLQRRVIPCSGHHQTGKVPFQHLLHYNLFPSASRNYKDDPIPARTEMSHSLNYGTHCLVYSKMIHIAIFTVLINQYRFKWGLNRLKIPADNFIFLSFSIQGLVASLFSHFLIYSPTVCCQCTQYSRVGKREQWSRNHQNISNPAWFECPTFWLTAN